MLRACTIAVLLLVLHVGYAENRTDLTQGIEALIEISEANLNVGISLVDLDTGKKIYARQDNRHYTPASVLKLFTSVSALSYLGPDYRFKTQLAYQPELLNNGTYLGDIYLVFGGDPSLTSDELSKLVSRLRQKGIKQIQGNLILVNTKYDQQDTAPGWMADDMAYCYGSATNGLVLDDNCVEYELTTMDSNARWALAKPIKSSEFVSVNSQVLVYDKPSECPLQAQNREDNSITITGCLPPNTKADLQLAVRDPLRYTQQQLTYLLQKYNVNLSGAIKVGELPANTNVLAEHQSQPLQYLIRYINKLSDNHFADSVFRKLGQQYLKGPGSWQQGAEAVTEILSKQYGIDATNLRLVDGSGLSRYNSITPKQLTKLLTNTKAKADIYLDLKQSLSIAGKDGTLNKRMLKPPLRGKVYAKTGGMTGVSTIAGYLTTGHNKQLAFAIMVEGFVGSSQKYQTLQDEILEYVYSKL